MSKVDEKKEFIGLLKNYMSITVAFILAIGAGISKLYLNGDINLLFWIGVLFIVGFVSIFALIARKTHKEVEKLRDLKD